MFVLDDNVYCEITLPVECAMHTPPHSIKLILVNADTETARQFLSLTRSFKTECVEEHQHPLKRMQDTSKFTPVVSVEIDPPTFKTVH